MSLVNEELLSIFCLLKCVLGTVCGEWGDWGAWTRSRECLSGDCVGNDIQTGSNQCEGNCNCDCWSKKVKYVLQDFVEHGVGGTNVRKPPVYK